MNTLPEVINWRRLNSRITLSGQPTEEQLSDIKNLGVTHVINLGPHTNQGALDDEAGTVEKLGMSYIYIPVDFDNPTEADYACFCNALEQHEDKQIHVHCIYNARVTAFFYRYCLSSQDSEADISALMDGIWRPGGIWAKFIGKEEDIDLPNRYAGYDY